MKSVPSPAVSLTMAAPRPGQIIGQRYRLVEWLERGAMGSVWRAEQIRLCSPAAIKFLDASLIQVPEMLERFLQEARSAAAVQSAHVIQVFDYGSDGGLPYIAMEFLEGENLASRLAFRGVLTPAELDKVFSELARGLGQAHALGVIHRDVKPGNIFLAREGQHEVTKLIDFGIAKVKEDALRVSQIVGTELGTVLGTPQYMSPEQLRGWSTVDHRTDLWALAVIACECLTGCCPFPGTTLGGLTVQICTEQPLTPSSLCDVPAGFDEWFFRGTRKAPSERFGSAAEMAEELSRILVPQRAPASYRTGPLSLPPSARDLRRAWASTSRRFLRLAGLTMERAAELASLRASQVRRRARGLTRAGVSQLRRAATTRSSGAVAVGLAMLVVAGAQLLTSQRSEPAAATVPAGAAPAAVAQALQAAAPASSAPLEVPASERAARTGMPVLSAEDLPLLPAGEQPPAPARAASAAAPTAAKASEVRRRPRKPEAQADSPPTSPMSEAMVRIGALMAQGADKRQAQGAGGATGAAPRRQARKE